MCKCRTRLPVISPGRRLNTGGHERNARGSSFHLGHVEGDAGDLILLPVFCEWSDLDIDRVAACTGAPQQHGGRAARSGVAVGGVAPQAVANCTGLVKTIH
jgi:hypothetical protein